MAWLFSQFGSGKPQLPDWAKIFGSNERRRGARVGNATIRA